MSLPVKDLVCGESQKRDSDIYNWYDSTPEAEQINEDVTPVRDPVPSRRIISLTTLSKASRERMLLAGLENTLQFDQLNETNVQDILGLDTESPTSILSKIKLIKEEKIVPRTGLESFESFESISTGCSAIDELFSFSNKNMRGTKRTYPSSDENDPSSTECSHFPIEHFGLPLGAMTEISGVPGIGKSTFCIQLAIMSQKEKHNLDNSNTVYIDTEGSLTCLVSRARSIAINNGIDPEKALRRIHACTIYDINELLKLLEGVKKICIKSQSKIRLVIIDSVSRILMNDTDSRQPFLYQLNSALQTLSRHGLAVLVVNHLDMVPGPKSQNLNNVLLRAGLGDAWSHFANHHLMMVYGKQKKRFALLAKSSLWPSKFTTFEINKFGISSEFSASTLGPAAEEETPVTSRQSSELKNLVASLTFDHSNQLQISDHDVIQTFSNQGSTPLSFSQEREGIDSAHHPILTLPSQSNLGSEFHPELTQSKEEDDS